MKSTFEKMGGTYTLGADGIYYPNLVSKDEEPHYGKYGRMRIQYLKEHRPAIYSLYMLEDRLTEHLNTVDDEAQERMDILVSQMMEKQAITEELKAYDTFICKLCEMARNQKRVSAKEKEVDNEKYAFRCFLLRLGFIGAEFKTERKILLRNLAGSSAFKSVQPKEVEVCE